MAYKITTKPNTFPIDSDYPFGDIKDNTGGNNGTPVNRLVYADFHQFFAKMAAEAAVTLNDLPDNAANGFQFFEALQNVISSTIAADLEVQGVTGVATKLMKAVIEIGSWDMDTDASITVSNSLYGVGTDSMVSVNAFILADSGVNQHFYPLITGDGSTITDIQGSIFVEKQIGADDFVLKRTTGGFFDSTSFNDSGINRGFIILEYIL